MDDWTQTILLCWLELVEISNLQQRIDPVFTPELASACILECTTKELQKHHGLKFVLKDWDRVGANDPLGHVEVPPSTLQNGSGDGLEFMVIPPTGREIEKAGYLLIRCRNATLEDEDLLKKQSNTNLFARTTKEEANKAWYLKPEPQRSKETVDAASASETRDTPKTVPTDATPDSRGECNPELGEELHLCIEIVSCRRLLSADKNGLSDPYVKIQMGGNDLHKTKHIQKT